MTHTAPADDRVVGTTYLPGYDDDAPPAVPRDSLGRMTLDDRFVRVGSWVSAFGLAWLLTRRLPPSFAKHLAR